MIVQHQRLFRLAVLAALSTAAACAPAPARDASDAPTYVDKSSAIASVRRDVRARYQEDVAAVDARNVGRYWVVDARTASGTEIRYTISQDDGAIRERNTFQ